MQGALSDSEERNIGDLARMNAVAGERSRCAAEMLRNRVVAAFLSDIATDFLRRSGELSGFVGDAAGSAGPLPGRREWREVEAAYGLGDVVVLTRIAEAVATLEAAYATAKVNVSAEALVEVLRRHAAATAFARQRLESLRDTLAARRH